MSLLVRRSGRKLGTARDARIAHAIHHKAIASQRFARMRFEKLYREWEQDYYKGKADELDKPKRPTSTIERYMPEGWTRLGSGAYRTAYLSPKGVVYKVNNSGYDSPYSDGTNYAEVTNILRIKESASLPKEWAIPDATLYRVSASDYVVAMPLLDTSAPLTRCYKWGNETCGCAESEGNKRMGGKCTTELFANATSIHGLSDMHTNNVFPDVNGVLWVVDCGI